MPITAADIRREVKEKNVTFIRLRRLWLYRARCGTTWSAGNVVTETLLSSNSLRVPSAAHRGKPSEPHEAVN